MSKSNLQNQYNVICARLGELEFLLAVKNQEKAALIKQASDLQKAWATIEAASKENEPTDVAE